MAGFGHNEIHIRIARECISRCGERRRVGVGNIHGFERRASQECATRNIGNGAWDVHRLEVRTVLESPNTDVGNAITDVGAGEVGSISKCLHINLRYAISGAIVGDGGGNVEQEI